MANYPKPTKGSRHNANTGYRSGIRRQLREDRQVQAKIRQELYDKLSLSEKTARLNLGNAQNGNKPFEASKQRHRLWKLRGAAEAATKKSAAPAPAETARAPKKARKEKRS